MLDKALSLANGQARVRVKLFPWQAELSLDLDTCHELNYRVNEPSSYIRYSSKLASFIAILGGTLILTMSLL